MISKMGIIMANRKQKSKKGWDFPGGPVVIKTSPSIAGGAGLIPGQGAKNPHTLLPKTKT